MTIFLSPYKCDIENVEDVGSIEGVGPDERLIVTDACILFPVLFPREKRNPERIERLSERLAPQFPIKPSEYLLKRDSRKITKRQIDVVNALEDGRFKERGIQIGVTNVVLGELRTLGTYLEGRHFREWWYGGIKEDVNFIYTPVRSFREKYPEISGMFEDNGDFSIALATYVLGTGFATDDYGTFNYKALKDLRGIYFDRWGLDRKFENYDSQALLMQIL